MIFENLYSLSVHGNYQMRTLALTGCFKWANVLIMKTPKYQIDDLRQFFSEHKIATIDQLKAVMGNPARCTVFRKLDQLQYLSSYSHRGKYYTLQSVAQFSTQGLWNFKSVWFSRFGNLLQTAETLVHNSEAGYSASELQEIVQVKTKHALVQLVRDRRLQRETFDSVFVYLSADDPTASKQCKARKNLLRQSSVDLIVSNPDLATEEAKAMLLLFCSMLDEKQRRLYAGLESLKLGHGGDAYIASLLGLDPHTVAKGRKELINGELSADDSIRAKGSGRPLEEKKRLKS